MNQTIQDMLQRRSIRKFKSTPVPSELVDQVVEAGLYAPSGMGRQGTKILVIDSKEWHDRISRDNCKIGGWKDGFDPFYGAPVILVVLADKSFPTCVYDGSLTIGNMLLAAHSLGLGSCWIHRAKEEFAQDDYKQLLRSLGIEGEWEGIGHVALGYADQAPATPQRKEGRVYHVK